MAELWTFDRFEAGQVFGGYEARFDEEAIGQLRAIYGDSAGLGEMFLVAAMMRTYIETIQPRPPGNIHAGQQLRFGGDVKPGDMVHLQVTVAAKELRNGRRWTTFAVQGKVEAQHVLSATIRSIWAV